MTKLSVNPCAKVWIPKRSSVEGNAPRLMEVDIKSVAMLVWSSPSTWPNSCNAIASNQSSLTGYPRNDIGKNMVALVKRVPDLVGLASLIVVTPVKSTSST